MKSRLPEKVFAVYVSLFYLLPGIAFYFGFRVDFYNYPHLAVPDVVHGVLLLLAVALGLLLERETRGGMSACCGPSRPQKWLWWLLATLIAVSSYGYFAELSGWRYSEASLSEDISLGTIAYISTPPIIEFLVFREIFFSDICGARRRASRLRALMLGLSAALSASGIGPMLLAAIVFIFGFFPDESRRIIYRRQRNTSQSGRSLFTWLSAVPVVVSIAAAAILSGELIKTGGQLDLVIFAYEEIPAVAFVEYFVGRFSTAWVSLLNALSVHTSSPFDGVIVNLVAPLQSFFFRLDTLIGGLMSVPRPSPNTLSRINYELITATALRAREGTSPGLLATFALSAPFWLSGVLLAFYVAAVARILAKLSAVLPARATWVGCGAVLYFFSSFFSSPLDLLLIFDQSTMSVVIFYVFIRRRYRSRGISNE